MTCGRSVDAGRRPKVSWWLAACRVLLWGEGATLGCGGLVAGFLGLITLTAGLTWAWLAFGSLSVALLAFALAVGLYYLAAVLAWYPSWPSRWNLVIVLFHVLLMAGGIALWMLVVPHLPDPPRKTGTDGPFVDGEIGMIGLAAYVFVACPPLIVTLLVWEQLHFFLRQSRRPGAALR